MGPSARWQKQAWSLILLCLPEVYLQCCSEQATEVMLATAVCAPFQLLLKYKSLWKINVETTAAVFGTEVESLWSTHEGEVKVSKDVLLLCGEDARSPRESEDRLEAGELLIEVPDVLLRWDDRQEGGLDLLDQ